jgi:hypothetical protein
VWDGVKETKGRGALKPGNRKLPHILSYVSHFKDKIHETLGTAKLGSEEGEQH